MSQNYVYVTVKLIHYALHLDIYQEHSLTCECLSIKVEVQQERETTINLFILWLQYNIMCIQNCVKYTFLWYYLCYNESKSVGCTEVHFS